MAINDNTSYELTGAQVKDLANKIKGKAADNTFVGATSAAPGSKGLVPQPQAGDNTKFLKGDGSWQSVADNYSTTEQVTNSTWIDGKTIYRKTVGTGALPNSAEKLTPHNISNLYRVIKLEGYAYRSTDGKMIPLPFAGSAGGATTVDVSVVNGNIRFLNAANMTAFAESNVTLYYTKS